MFGENFLRDIIQGKMMGKATWVHDMMEGRDYEQLKDLISDRSK